MAPTVSKESSLPRRSLRKRKAAASGEDYEWPDDKIADMLQKVVGMVAAARDTQQIIANMEGRGGCWAMAFMDALWCTMSHDFDRGATTVTAADRVCEALVRKVCTQVWNGAYAREGQGNDGAWAKHVATHFSSHLNFRRRILFS